MSRRGPTGGSSGSPESPGVGELCAGRPLAQGRRGELLEASGGLASRPEGHALTYFMPQDRTPKRVVTKCPRRLPVSGGKTKGRRFKEGTEMVQTT